VDGGLSAFAHEEDIITELAKSFVKGKAAGETLEALFQASRESHADGDRFLDDSAAGVEQAPGHEGADPAPCLRETYVVVTDSTGQLGFEFV